MSICHARNGQLSRREALLVRELIRAEGRVLSYEVLLEATHSWGGTERQERKRIAALVHWVRLTFGPEVIETIHGKGYRIGKLGREVAA